MEIANPIAAIWWFFYRVIYTMVPAMLFTLGSYQFMAANFSGNRFAHDRFIEFEACSTTTQIIIFSMVAILINILVESLVTRLVYFSLGFTALSEKLLKIMGTQRYEGYIPTYNRMQVRSLMHSNKVFMHAEYLLAREFLFNNSWIILVICLIFYFPLTLAKMADSNFFAVPWLYAIVTTFQFVVVYYSVIWMMKWIDNLHVKSHTYNQKELEKSKDSTIDTATEFTDYNNYKKKMEKYFFCIAIGALVLLMLVPSLIKTYLENSDAVAMLKFISMLFGMDLLVLLLCYFLLYTAFREFFNVEKTMHGYRLETNPAANPEDMKQQHELETGVDVLVVKIVVDKK